MIVLISGTNRPDNRTSQVARIVHSMLQNAGAEVFLIDLRELPPALFEPTSYAEKPPEFAKFQDAIFKASGILTVTPEYNGSFPGVLKYFIDMLKFPESLKDVPCAFIGIAAGEWGGLRSVEQLEMIFQYRSAHLYGKRCFLKQIYNLLDDEGNLPDPTMQERLQAMVEGFVDFAERQSDA